MTTSKSLSLILALLTLLIVWSSATPALLLFGGAVLILGIRLLWPADDTPILLLPFLLQFLPVAVKPVQSALMGVPLNDLAGRGADLGPAAWFGFAGLAGLAIGLHLGRRRGMDHAAAIRAEAAAWPQSLIVMASLAAIGTGHLLAQASGYAGGARQALLMLGSIRLAGLFLLTYWCLSQNRALGLLACILLFETAYGMTGFYGEFKTTILVAGLAALLAKPRVNVGTVATGTALLASMLVALFFWSAIKPEYRAFMMNGSASLSINRDFDERVAFLSQAVSEIDGSNLAEGAEIFLSRLSYIDFLGSSLDHVPAVVPHTGGSQTLGALRHIVTPRILFPGKPPLPHDTYVTSQFTGLYFNSYIASISLGYLGEFYVDFGYAGALVAMILLGMVIARMYGVLMAYDGLPKLLNAALAAMLMVPLCFFERALAKLVGGTLTTFIACLLLQRVGLPFGLRLLGFERLITLARAPSRPAPPSGSLPPPAPA